MKKVILPLCAAAILAGATACGSKSSKPRGEEINYTQEDKLLGDSLSEAYGAVMGLNSRQQIEGLKTTRLTPAQAEAFNLKSYLKGVKDAAKVDTADLDYMLGLQAGMQLWFAANGMPPALKVPVTADAMIKSFEAVLKADSITDEPEIQGRYQYIISRVQTLQAEKELAAIENSEESINNKAAGAAYADSLVAKEGFTRAESGLVYKIENPGGDVKVQPNNRLSINYKGSHINGEVFDQSKEGAPMTSYASHFIPGFTEGLTLLGEGGKATIVIPGDIAYGARGQKPTIGYNETLVFDIEVVEILK